LAVLTSGYAAYAISHIKRRYAAKVRLPKLRSALRSRALTLLNAAQTADFGLQNRSELLSALTADLRALRRHLPRPLKRTWKTANTALKGFSRELSGANVAIAPANISALWPMYEALQLLENELDHYLADERLVD